MLNFDTFYRGKVNLKKVSRNCSLISYIRTDLRKDLLFFLDPINFSDKGD